MKLLLDQNLSPRLVVHLQSDFPGSSHVRQHGLEHAEDAAIWDFAKQLGFAIVSKDADFHQMSFLFGAPPKVVWVRLGNCTTDQILDMLLRNLDRVAEFEREEEAAFLALE